MIPIEVLGWLATITLLVGYYLNAKKMICSWIVWLHGNALMLIYALAINSYSVAFLSIALVVLNIYGYISWKSRSK
tara:strand:- start:349 stop:576 length:228 start_codon:yes stop_codon:yes gene_type:complete